MLTEIYIFFGVFKTITFYSIFCIFFVVIFTFYLIFCVHGKWELSPEIPIQTPVLWF